MYMLHISILCFDTINKGKHIYKQECQYHGDDFESA